MILMHWNVREVPKGTLVLQSLQKCLTHHGTIRRTVTFLHARNALRQTQTFQIEGSRLHMRCNSSLSWAAEHVLWPACLGTLCWLKIITACTVPWPAVGLCFMIGQAFTNIVSVGWHKNYETSLSKDDHG